MPYYTAGTPATRLTLARAENIAAELVTIVAAFDKIPEQLSLEQGRAVYALDTGAADAYVVALPATMAAYTTGLTILMKAVNANTGASTVNVDSKGVKSIKRFNGDALSAGDIPEDGMVVLHYDGVNFQTPGDQSGTATNAVIGPASSTDNAVTRFNGTTGKLAQNSGDTLDDSNIYTHAGQSRWKKGSNLTSADPLVLGTDGNFFEVDGSAGISSITVAAGTLFMLKFNGAPLLTDGASFDLAGQDIATSAGARVLFFATAADTVVMVAPLQRESVRPLKYATQSEQEAATAVAAATTPGRQHYHPSAAKGWVKFTNAGVILASYNVASVTETGTGDWVVTWDTDFSSADYLTIVNHESTTTLLGVGDQISGSSEPLAGSVQIHVMDEGTNNGDETDIAAIHVMAFGDQ